MSAAGSAGGVTAFVFARGGSKGLPRKNLRLLGGVPLIGHAIRTALAAPGVDRCVVSTEDEEIAEVARSFGAVTPVPRPAELAQDGTPEWAVWQHAIRTVLGSDLDQPFLVVPATAPLRSTDDITACLATFAQGDADVVVTMTEAHRNPSFNMVRVADDGSVDLVLPPAQAFAGRQAAPPVYDMTTVAYVADPRFVLRAERIFDGRVRAVLVPPERAIDIDTELDLVVAEALLAWSSTRHDG
jgi:CMP-N-acetylneuraminic acid synthetase